MKGKAVVFRFRRPQPEDNIDDLKFTLDFELAEIFGYLARNSQICRKCHKLGNHRILKKPYTSLPYI